VYVIQNDVQAQNCAGDKPETTRFSRFGRTSHKMGHPVIAVTAGIPAPALFWARVTTAPTITGAWRPRTRSYTRTPGQEAGYGCRPKAPPKWSFPSTVNSAGQTWSCLTDLNAESMRHLLLHHEESKKLSGYGSATISFARSA